MTQRALATRLGVSQQAIARAERWDANPTVAFLRRWFEACGMELKIDFEVMTENAREGEDRG